MSDDAAIPDDMTELYDAKVPRLDLVGKGANGLPLLIAKEDAESAGAFEPGFVRGLIAKSERPRAAETPEVVTMSGSPAALAEVMHRIHGAPIRKAAPAEPDGYEALVKAKYDTAERERMAASGAAREDGSYPIADRDDVHNAVMAVGRGDKDEHNAIRRHIIRRADSLGAKSMIPDSWNANGSLAKTDAEPTEVTKDMDTATDGPAGDALDPTVVFAEPGEEMPGDPNDPGSPAWEAQDAANARKWTAIAARLRAALDVMSDREILEAVSADPDDAYAAEDLASARDAVDYVISVLAPFAVGEECEAQVGAEQYASVTKAISALDTGHLDTLETLGALRKAGRTLSAANESALRSAVDSLQSILASLPKAAPDAQAPAAGAGIAKEAPVAEYVESALTDRHPLGTPKDADALSTVPGPGAVAKEQEPAADAPVEKAAEQPGVEGAPAEPVEKAAEQAEPAQGSEQVVKAEGEQPAAEAVPVEKAAEQAAAEPAAAATPAQQPVEKAKTPQVAIYDEKGNLVGTVDPAEITMLAPAKAPDAPAAPAAEQAADDPTPAPAPIPEQPAPAAAPTDLTPMPSADAGTPADDVAKSTDERAAAAAGESEYVLKSSFADLIKAAFDDHSATQEQAYLAKAQETAAQLAEVTKALEQKDAALDELTKSTTAISERLTALENAPAVMAIASNGVLPPAHHLRGQNQGSAAADATTGALLKSKFRNADDAIEQKQTAEAMTALAMEKFQAMQQAARR